MSLVLESPRERKRREDGLIKRLEALRFESWRNRPRVSVLSKAKPAQSPSPRPQARRWLAAVAPAGSFPVVWSIASAIDHRRHARAPIGPRSERTSEP